MSYTDILFVALFVGVCVLSRLLRRWPAIREWTIIGFGLLIVASWGLFSLALLLAVAAVNFAAAVAAAPAAPKRRRAILIGAIVFDLAALGFFKYGGFITSNADSIFDAKLSVPALGIPLAI